MKIDKCRFCGNNAKLQDSHIIPSFAVKWLKSTSATGLLRKAINPNLPIQDSTKIKLLCKKCEDLFSKWENYFAQKIFYPYIENTEKPTKFVYSEELRKFIISVCWRILETEKEIVFQKTPHLIGTTQKVLDIWKRYLNGSRNSPATHEINLFFTGGIESVSDDIDIDDVRYFASYILRAIDATAIESDTTFGVYFKLPCICVFVFILPHPYEFEGTQIYKKGEIKNENQKATVGDFLLERSSVRKNAKISPKQMQKIIDRIQSNPEKALKSKSFEPFIIREKIEKRREK